MNQPSAHQAIYRRWRAQTFAQIVGQEAVVTTLRNAVRTGRVAHAVLFVGPRGTGKTSLARILAKALNCTNLQDGDPCDACPSCVAIREGTTLDVVEIDAASNRGINEVRDLRDRLQYAPTALRRKVYILDEAHQITRDAWNALLKSLEEPPDFVVFMFASTHPQEFPPAILSRLQRFDVRRLTTAEIEGKLARILEADGRTADPAAVTLIARLAAGGMRDAESMLDQLLSSTDGRLDERSVRDLLGLAEAEAVEGFSAALAGRAPAAGIAILDDLEERGRDLRTFLDQVVESIRSELVGDLAGAPSRARADVVAAARRIAAIDPNRAGLGGLRLQLELALFDEGPAADVTWAGVAPTIGRSTDDAALVQPDAAPAAPVQPDAAPGGPTSRPGAMARRQDPKMVRAEPPASAATAPGASTSEPDAAERNGRDHSSHQAAPEPALIPSGPDTPGEPGEQDVSTSVLSSGSASDEPSDLARLRVLWPQIVAHISAHPPTRPLIVACRPVAVDGNIVTLGFPEDQGFLKDVAVRRRPNLEAGIAQFLGHPVNVRCVATNLDAVATETPDPGAAFLLAEARRIFAEDLVEPDEIR